MKKIFISCVIALFSACGVQESNSSGLQSQERAQRFREVVTIDGSDGQLLFEAVYDLLGEENTLSLTVRDLSCRSVKQHSSHDLGVQLLNNNTVCTYVMPDSGANPVRKVSDLTSAETIMTILARYGASKNGGINGLHVFARGLKCVKGGEFLSKKSIVSSVCKVRL